MFIRKIIAAAFLSLFFLQACQKKESVLQNEEIDFDKASIELMEDLRPKLLGTWTMKEVHVRPYPPYASELRISKDTILKDFGILIINRVDSDSQEYYRTNSDVTGVLEFKTKKYPVGFRMLATPEYVYKKTGPHVFMLFETRFPVGSRPMEPEESFLYNLSLIGENYSLEISDDGKTMIWKGLNRAIKSIRFIKS